jgi:hypothetical protein
MSHVRSAWFAVGLLACGCATASLPPPRPRVGLGVLDIDSSPSADAVSVVRRDPPLAVDEGAISATQTPARFEVKPGKYEVALWRDGGRYAYDLRVDVRELERHELEVQLRSSDAYRVEATVFAGLGLAATGALGFICADKHNQACGGAAAVAALTGVVGWYAVQAWRHDGRLLASETTSLGKKAPPPVLRAAPPAPPPPAEAPAAAAAEKKPAAKKQKKTAP